MYRVVTTKSFDKALARLPLNWQKRIVAKAMFLFVGYSGECNTHQSVIPAKAAIPLQINSYICSDVILATLQNPATLLRRSHRCLPN